MTAEEYTKHIKEEIEGAKEYAKLYIGNKSVHNCQWANRYKEMSQDELKHAKYIYEEAMSCLDFADTEPITDVYVETAATVAYMLKL